jgi:hypothetical protein
MSLGKFVEWQKTKVTDLTFTFLVAPVRPGLLIGMRYHPIAQHN